jgi:hypothetical protein
MLKRIQCMTVDESIMALVIFKILG